ncbi:UNVERIFIED_CONTAM: hypothetical protein FKN15_070561 [Acipenser sinensis]
MYNNYSNNKNPSYNNYPSYNHPYFSDGINVHQSPLSLFESPGRSTELNCSHDASSYQYMCWYQQTRKGALELIGYLNNEIVNPEGKFKERFILTGDARKAGSLTISSVTAEDSAVYLCAASKAQCCRSPLSSTINLPTHSLPNASLTTCFKPPLTVWHCVSLSQRY